MEKTIGIISRRKHHARNDLECVVHDIALKGVAGVQLIERWRSDGEKGDIVILLDQAIIQVGAEERPPFQRDAAT